MGNNNGTLQDCCTKFKASTTFERYCIQLDLHEEHYFLTSISLDEQLLHLLSKQQITEKHPLFKVPSKQKLKAKSFPSTHLVHEVIKPDADYIYNVVKNKTMMSLALFLWI